MIAAKTVKLHPRLQGTIYSAAEDIEKLGGKCLPLEVDVRNEDQVREGVKRAVETFGSIDILVNNASAISLTNTTATDMKKFDLMFGVNVRGTYLCSKYCIPHMEKNNCSKILNISPPLNMSSHWFKDHCAYTMAKYGMSMCVLGMADELKPVSISVNALWPKTAIYTAAMEMLGGKDIMSQCRKPEIMSDAAYVILTDDNHSNTGNFYIDEDVLNNAGIKTMENYNYVESPTLLADFFIDGSTKHTHELKTSVPAFNESLKDILEAIRVNVNKDLVQEIKAIYLFDLKSQGTILLDLKNGSGQLLEMPTGPSKADVTLTLNAEDFLKMFTKEMRPTTAYMTGRLKIQGDLAKAMRLENFLKTLKI